MLPIIRAVLRSYGLWPWWPWPSGNAVTRIAVAAYIVPRPDPNNPGQYLPDWNGEPRDWTWVLRQWDRIAAAGQAVRLVVAEQSYTDLQGSELYAITSKLMVCREVGQAVFGYVFGSGGAIPLGPPQSWWSVPRDPATNRLNGPVTQVAASTPGAFPCVQDQIDAWKVAFPDKLDGIYVDVGPMDCLDPNSYGGQANIPQNYADYCSYIQQAGLGSLFERGQVFLLTPQYDDQDPFNPGWLRALPWDFLGLWEADAPTYESKFNAWNVCANTFTSWPPGNPDASWWDPVRVGGPAAARNTRVHVINGGAKIHVDLGWLGELFPWLQAIVDELETKGNLFNLMQLAMSRGAATVWITEAEHDPVLGAVYDQLPPYWDDEVALCS